MSLPRPSSLPKLALCSKFVSNPTSGEYAERGQAMDVLFRDMITGTSVQPDVVPVDPSAPPAYQLEEEDIAAVQWAVTTARFMARGAFIEARESELLVDPGNGVKPGTADCLCETERWSADLKSGLVRDYIAQQRAYALGFMDRFFVNSWTIYLLFCDERQMVTLTFERETAIAETQKLMASVKDPEAVATPNDYCDLCELRFRCPQKLELVAWFLRLDPATVNLMDHMGDPEKLGPLMDLTYDIAQDEKGVHAVFKAAGLALWQAGKPLPGWRLQNGNTSESVPAMQLAQLIELLGAPRVLAMMASVTGKKFREAWEMAKPGVPIPDGIIKTNHGSAFLVKKPKSKARAEKTKTEEKTNDNG